MRTLTLLMTCGLSLACGARASAAPPPAAAPAAATTKTAPPAPAAEPPAAAGGGTVDLVLWSGADEADATRWLAVARRIDERLGDVYSQPPEEVRRVKRADGTYAVVLGTCPAGSAPLARAAAFLRHLYPQVRTEPAAGPGGGSCPHTRIPEDAKWRTVEREAGRRLVFLRYLEPYGPDSGWAAGPDTGAVTHGLVLVDADQRIKSAQFKSYPQGKESPAAGVDACQLQVDEEPDLVRINATCKAQKWECAERRYLGRERATLWYDGKEVYQATEVLEARFTKRCPLAD